MENRYNPLFIHATVLQRQNIPGYLGLTWRFARLGVLVLLFLGVTAAQKPPTQPSPWRTVVMGTRGMVAAEHPLQARAGLRVLEQGGNAVDAAVAMFYMTSVTEQHQAGLGGDAVMLAYLAGPKRVVFIRGTGPAPKLATPEFYRTKFGGIPLDGPYSTNVPGSVSAFDLILKKYGSRKYDELIRDAIETAENGHALSEYNAAQYASDLELIRRYPSSAQALLRKGQPLAAGEVLVQRDLAKSLRTVVKEGAESFYRGSLARLTVDTYRKHDGLLRYEDLAAFQAREDEPIHIQYKGYSVYQTGASTTGIVQLIAMNILKGFDLKALRHNSPEYLHVVVEALKLAFADRNRYVSDPERNPIPTQALLSEEYAAARRQLIRTDRAIRDVAPPGAPEKMQPILDGHSIKYEEPGQQIGQSASAAPYAGETSSFTVADRFGNLLSVTHSVNGTFGAGIIVEGGGYLLNNRLPYFSLKPDHVNVLAPGKQTMHTICAALATRDGKPFMAWNTPGGDNQTQALLQAFLNVVEFGMSEQQALEQPTVTTTNLYPSMYPHEPGDKLLVPKSLADRVGTALAAKGHRLTVNILQQPYFQQVSGAGAIKMITIDPRTGVLRGAVSPAKDNYVAGW